MADPDRAKKLQERVARLEQQLTRSENALNDVLKQLKASRSSAKKESDEKLAKLKKDLEDQRLEFEGLVGRLHEEMRAVQDQRDQLARRLEESAPKQKQRSPFDDEPTSTYSHQDMKDVVKREMLVAEEEPFFEDEEVTASHAPSQPSGGKDQKT